MNKVIVGMSGGVDSSVAAYLLQKEGYEVIGVTSIMYAPNANIDSLPEVIDAAEVCKHLGIEHHISDMRDVFARNVIAPFVNEYLQGKTPNPCNMCNRHIKWQALIDYADSHGIRYIATGHYARITQIGDRFTVCNSKTAAKDQTYALCMLTQEQLARTLMPLGDYTKDEIRSIAEELNLPVAHKKDSQDICFIPDGDYATFIDNYIEATYGKNVSTDTDSIPNLPHPGDFIDTSGKVLGTHKGITHYTIGQRRGLDIPAGKRIFVQSINTSDNTVILGSDEELYTTELIADHINLMSIDEISEPIRAIAKIRYAHKGTPATIEYEDGLLKIHFDEPVRAITPGQCVVIYDNENILGAGIIR